MVGLCHERALVTGFVVVGVKVAFAVHDLFCDEFAELLQENGVGPVQVVLRLVDQFDVFAFLACFQQLAEHVEIALDGGCVVCHGLRDGCRLLSGTDFHDTHNPFSPSCPLYIVYPHHEDCGIMGKLLIFVRIAHNPTNVTIG